MAHKTIAPFWVLAGICLAAACSAGAVERDEAMVAAAEFATAKWYCGEENVLDCDRNDCPVVGTDFNVGEWYTGLPYKWGGYETMADFYESLVEGLHAGTPEYECIAACAVGLDCSGFVSRCWGYGNDFRLSTAVLPFVCTEIEQAELTFGDAINRERWHVALFDHLADSGKPIVYESTPPLTGQFERPWSYFDGYSFFRFNEMTGDGKFVRLAAGLELSDRPIVTSADPSDMNVEVRFTIHNYGPGTVVIDEVTAAIRHGDGSEYLELESYSDVSLDPDGEFAYPAAEAAVTEPGFYAAVARYRIGDVWHDIPPFEPGTSGRQFFEVYSSTIVQLSEFDVLAGGGRNTVLWTTTSEVDNAGWNLYRAEGGPDEEFTRINPETIAPNQYDYEYVDEGTDDAVVYCYQLEATGVFGAVQFFGPECADDDNDDDDDDDVGCGCD